MMSINNESDRLSTTIIINNVTQLLHREFNHNKITFSWYDYILFTLMLLCSALIGIYFGCFGSKQSSANEYLMGGKTMKVIPISISLVASHVSGITLLALPADVYRYGAGYWLGSFSMIILYFITVYVYLPVFFQLQITSTYEYLERRFDNRARKFSSFLFGLSVFLYLPIVVYIPALAFSAVTGINVHLISPLVCGVCIFYTTIGGLKAVVWTDTLQFTVTVGAVATVFILGVKSAGGFPAVWSIAVEGQRLDIIDFSFDPTKRDSIWIALIGLTVHWTGLISVNQGCIQKFLSLPTFHDAKISVIYFSIGMVVIKTASVLTGLVMYAKYVGCDPFTTKEVTRNDQLLPYYVLDVARSIPGLSGLFIAGVFSAALSTLSATLNCLAGTIYEDFVKQFMRPNITEKQISNILKLIVIITGIISTGLVFIIEHLGGLLALAISLQSVSNGPLLAMFTIGLLFPRANSKGVFYGALLGMIFTGWVVFTARYYQTQGLFIHQTKPISTEGCLNNTSLLHVTNSYFNDTLFIDPMGDNFTELNYTLSAITSTPASTSTINVISSNTTTSTTPTSNGYKPFFLFRISHYYYTFLGTSVSMILGLIISYATANNDDLPVDRALLSPVIYFLLPKPKTENHQNTVQYYGVEKALNLVVNNDFHKD